MRKSYRKALSLALALATMLSLLAGCGNRSAGLGDSLGLDVDPAEVAMPLADRKSVV